MTTATKKLLEPAATASLNGAAVGGGAGHYAFVRAAGSCVTIQHVAKKHAEELVAHLQAVRT